MSHVIPPHVFQVLKSHRWNCNVLGRRRKFGHPNYVRVLGCEARGSNSCVRSSAQHTLHDARDASTRMHICGPTHRIMGQRAQTAPTRQHDHMHQLKYRLSRTRKPKSHPSSNTQCPITLHESCRPHRWAAAGPGQVRDDAPHTAPQVPGEGCVEPRAHVSNSSPCSITCFWQPCQQRLSPRQTAFRLVHEENHEDRCKRAQIKPKAVDLGTPRMEPTRGGAAADLV